MATTIDRPPSQLLGRSALANLSVAALYEKAIERSEGMLAAAGPLVVRTGKHTGRSPKDKFIVDEPDSHDGVWWGGFNQPISEERYDALRQRIDQFSHPKFGEASVGPLVNSMLNFVETLPEICASTWEEVTAIANLTTGLVVTA